VKQNLLALIASAGEGGMLGSIIPQNYAARFGRQLHADMGFKRVRCVVVGGTDARMKHEIHVELLSLAATGSVCVSDRVFRLRLLVCVRVCMCVLVVLRQTAAIRRAQHSGRRPCRQNARV